MLNGKRIVLVICGGIAAYKSLDLIRRLREREASVRVVLTRAAENFVTPMAVAALSGHRVHSDLFSIEHDLHGFTAQRLRDGLLENLKIPGDANELGLHALGDYARGGIPTRTGQSTTPQGRVHMDVTVGDQLRTGIDGSKDHQIAPLGINALSGSYRLVYQQGGTAHRAGCLSILRSRLWWRNDCDGRFCCRRGSLIR